MTEVAEKIPDQFLTGIVREDQGEPGIYVGGDDIQGRWGQSTSSVDEWR